MSVTRIRRARRQRTCEGCHGPIHPGDLYRSYVLFPDDPDVGNVGFWRMSECADCCDQFHRPVIGPPKPGWSGTGRA